MLEFQQKKSEDEKMSKKKVLFVVHQLNYGGVQKALLSALNAIDYDKYDVTLYVRKARLDLLKDVNKRVNEIIINDDNQHYYRKPYSLWMLFLLKLSSLFGHKDKEETIKSKLGEYIAIQKIQYEQEHFFSDGKKYDVAISYIQGYPAKLVADCVNADRKIMFFHGSTDENHALHESIFDKIDAVVGVNEGVQKVLEGLYPKWKEKMTYLKNFVDAEEIREKSREFEIDIPQGRIVLCSCGRLTPVKGLDLAVRAAKILKEAGEQFTWYFVGDGPERSRLEDMIYEYGMEEDIIITGMQSNPYPWINACDIYVQPSYEEAHPLSIIEAQILCKPVVSTSTVGGTVLVQNGVNGCLSEISETSLAGKIADLIKSPESRTTMTENMKQTDYSAAFEQYRVAWRRLLEG